MLSITEHNSEGGLDAHDSGNKDQQKTVNFGRATTLDGLQLLLGLLVEMLRILYVSAVNIYTYIL